MIVYLAQEVRGSHQRLLVSLCSQKASEEEVLTQGQTSAQQEGHSKLQGLGL